MMKTAIDVIRNEIFSLQLNENKSYCIAPKNYTRGKNNLPGVTFIMETNESKGNRVITLHGKKVKVLGIRRLTPTECARLQTIPEWYKWECSDTQAYRMIGNGWTVEVIKHFFSFLPWAKKEVK